MFKNDAKKAVEKKNKPKERGRGIPYIYKNKIYFGKKPQTGTGVAKVIARLLENVGDIIGVWWFKKNTFGISI